MYCVLDGGVQLRAYIKIQQSVNWGQICKKRSFTIVKILVLLLLELHIAIVLNP